LKVAISCDDLLVRDHYTEIVETLGLVFEDAEIYTLVHREKALLGTIELRKIHSTYLSHKIQDREHLAKNSFLIPNAAKNLFIPCSVDVIINVTNGMSQGIKKCEGTKLITYFYDNFYFNRENKSLREKIFKSYTTNWSMDALSESDEVWVPNSAAKTFLEEFYKGPISVVNPPFRIDDYPLMPKMDKTFEYYAVNVEDMTTEMAQELSAFFSKYSISFKFFGDDSHLEKMKYHDEDWRFFGVKCSGELAPFLANAKAVIDVSNRAFPENALKGLSSGRPLICAENEMYKSYLGDYGILWSKRNSTSIIEGIKDMNNLFQTYDRKKLHAIATNFHETKFKADIRRRVGPSIPKNLPESCC